MRVAAGYHTSMSLAGVSIAPGVDCMRTAKYPESRADGLKRSPSAHVM